MLDSPLSFHHMREGLGSAKVFFVFAVFLFFFFLFFFSSIFMISWFEKPKMSDPIQRDPFTRINPRLYFGCVSFDCVPVISIPGS